MAILEGEQQADLRGRSPGGSADLDWVYRPAGGGFASSSRHYLGHATSPPQQLIRPGCPVMLTLVEGDLLSLTNRDGATPVWLIPFGCRGECEPALLGLTQNPLRSLSLLREGFEDVRAWFASCGGAERDATVRGIQIFDDTTLAGEEFTLRATGHVVLWMLTEPDTWRHVKRLFNGGLGGAVGFTRVRSMASEPVLPPPLGDVREEFTVSAGTAFAYQLAAGETVQIIDVSGQQCSDFMAMNARALDCGRERFIDCTVTRSMVRSAYPAPGLMDKFYDQDMQPLLRLKQDTVGRHDTFALACTARGYEERGFFGHLNCSDNISRAYSSYGIAERRAWPAINFFFNSWIDHRNNAIQTDEAWSRAGDYVALQAMTDLVAVSTACPDDVDPINGWNPTDIHVRIYKKHTPIRHAVSYRSEPGVEAILTEHSAFHPRTSALTRQFVVARDQWLPRHFEATRAIEEYQACRNAVTVQDLSSLRKFDVLGPDAEALLQLALTRDMRKLSVSRGVYALLCDQSGHVIDDGTLFRLAPDAFRWCCGSDESGCQLKDIAAANGLNVWIKALYSTMPNLAVQGPKSRELISRIAFTQPTATAVEQLKWFGSTVARLHDRDGAPFQLTRTGFTGELGYEIFCHTDSALVIWDAVIEAGANLGITPMGLDALETIRIEAGLMAAGAEFGPEVDAFESGLGFAVDFAKGNFIGRAALERNQKAPRRVLRGLRFVGHEAPTHGDTVLMGRREIGVVTSATVSPVLDCAIAIARIAVEHADIGSEVEVGKLDGHSKRLRATCCDLPFVDPTRSRARA